MLSVSDFLRLISLQDPNTRVVMLGVALLGLVCGVVGSFAVLRRRALVGDAVAHASLPGVCAAYFIVGDRNFAAFLFGAFLFGLLAVACITLIRRSTRLKEDAAIAVVLSVFFGLGIALSRIIQNDAAGSRAGLDSFLFGKAAGMIYADVTLISLTALVALIAVTLLHKEFRLLCFDPEFAASLGRPVLLLDLLLMALICLCTVIGLPAVGVVLVVALLIVPAAAARFWTDRLAVMLVFAGAFGALSGVAGAAASALVPRLSAGPAIALAAASLFIVSLLCAPKRGVLAAAMQRAALRRKILLENLLRALHELDDARITAPQASALALRRTWTARQVAKAAALARSKGFVRGHEGGLTLTESGAARASEVVRAHRLWELYLIDNAFIASDHVDRDADLIEHVLPPDVLARLENLLRTQGRLPTPVPSSPHDLATPEARGPHD